MHSTERGGRTKRQRIIYGEYRLCRLFEKGGLNIKGILIIIEVNNILSD